MATQTGEVQHFREMLPFEVVLTIFNEQNSALGVNEFQLTTILSKYFNEFYEGMEDVSEEFKTVVLSFQAPGRRRLQTTSIVRANYEAESVWGDTANKTVPDGNRVVQLQLLAMKDSNGNLLRMLQGAPDASGLGSDVQGVELNYQAGAVQEGGGSGGLDAVVAVAIVLAGLACLLLVVALGIAWHRKSKQEVYQVKTKLSPGSHNLVHRIDTSSPNRETPDTVSPTGLYPDSVISEDISTSLTAYYKSGMGESRQPTDAYSVSSVESYGYSLDGYASSIAPGSHYGA
mmetsp:Transcript_6162/g.9361  ORF Transcript_6162/g.9361 Transcript_6162/m.9361 type:complete len:288 (+) Transcript_6162:120-983(+)|eukprot:CAMPEP_0118676128 /NCGR_PEP_ID=MMETSP0800-20121206/1862_1 /TAXON_ID=210618 ORGANISM="Striatella unipunctata, Strain CCMP2910" /NCGR_SAMPLE_ID=MMETSP0800 /ASSEMBLY_ACC=CAM_ASM_000638 /LENGTH=287 /DNA_ID=CAMNT_0006571581 /DNA_START=102 /DNA_END=965 /DNA_ORIENTATION=-